MAEFNYNRPRRPNPETLTYLKSLPLAHSPVIDEISKIVDDSDEEFPSVLSACFSAIEEIRHEVASLAGDEDGAQIIEIIAKISLPYSETAARVLMAGLSGYYLHLTTHRYGSHVVQTILQHAVMSLHAKDFAQHNDAPQLSTKNLPSLQELISDMVKELSPSAAELALHICGSHVLRSITCILGGVQLHQPDGHAIRRGREKPKKKKKKQIQDDSRLVPNVGILEMTIAPKNCRFKPDLVLLQSLLDSFLLPQYQNGKLQQMACHPSAGPLLMVSLRVLTFCHASDQDSWMNAGVDIQNVKLGIHKAQPQYNLESPAHNIVKQLLLLESKDDKVGQIVYGLSGEPRGSHVLELLLRISPNEIYDIILHKGDFANALKEYVEHDVSNFVVQTLFSTVRSKEQANILLTSVERLIENGLVIDAKRSRVGIFWRAVELAAKFQVHQEELLKALRIGTATLQQRKEGTPDDGDEKVNEDKMKNRLDASPSVALKECIAPLLNMAAPLQYGDRLTLGVEGTRAVYHLLRFEPKFCVGILDGVTKPLTAEELELLAKDGLGSRCVWDGVLDGPRHEKPFERAARTLLTKLSGRWVALASDRVGHHCVTKLFDVLKVDDKAVLTAELAQGSNRLGGCFMGRTVMESCAVHPFLEGEKAWKDALRKRSKDDTWLKELLVPEEAGKKRKRKQKQFDDPEKVSKLSIVDSIVDTISKAIKQ